MLLTPVDSKRKKKLFFTVTSAEEARGQSVGLRELKGEDCFMGHAHTSVRVILIAVADAICSVLINFEKICAHERDTLWKRAH